MPEASDVPNGASPSALNALASRSSVRKAPKLADAERQQLAASLATWEWKQDAIEKTFSFPGYAETIAFVNAIAWIAQRLDHHPDLQVGFKGCRVTWTTHDAGGVTMNDAIAAARTELLLA